jgi:hypothetical protein
MMKLSIPTIVLTVKMAHTPLNHAQEMEHSSSVIQHELI